MYTAEHLKSYGMDAPLFLNVHGHLHSKRIKTRCAFGEIIDDLSYFNVSVEQHNLTPVHADVIIQRMESLC